MPALSLFFCTHAYAQERFRLHFARNESEFFYTLLDNEQTLQSLKKAVDAIGPENIQSVDVTVFASPEGPYQFNQDLCRRRSNEFSTAVLPYLRGAEDKIHITIGGEAWEELRKRVATAHHTHSSTCFKGNKANYKNAKADQYGSPDTRPIFTSNKTVKIAGHIMSLIAGDNYSDTTPMPEDAFNGAFSKGSDADNTDITIDAEDPLIFPSTINVRCYKNMFRGCKNLVTVPDLPATTIASECYYSMFRRCPNLISVKCNLQGTVTRAEIENAVDKWFVKSGSTTMLNTNGTFYCPAAMKDVWDELHVANHSLGGIPTTWQIVTY